MRPFLIVLSLVAVLAPVAQAAPPCPTAPLAYRVYLKQGAEFVEVENPRVEHGQLVYEQYGGEVRQDADNLLKIEPRSPETAEMIQHAMAWETEHAHVVVGQAKQYLVANAGALHSWQIQDFAARLDLLEAARVAYIQACGR